MTGLAGETTEIGDRVVAGKGVDGHPGHHHVSRHFFGERDGAGEQRQLGVVELALLARRSDHELELFERTDSGELLTRLDPKATDRPVGGSVEEEDDRPQEPVQERHRNRHQDRGGIWLGDGEVLRHQLADQHRCHVGDEQRQADLDRRVVGHTGPADSGEQRVEQVGQCRLGDGAGQQRRHGDPELRSGQLERELTQAPVDLCCPPIPFHGKPLHPTAINGNEGELTSDEEGSEKDEDRNG